jgi:hypothetical protein
VPPSGTKCDETMAIEDADRSPALAASVSYHTTIRPCVEGEQKTAEILNLFRQRDKSMWDLAALLSGASDSERRQVRMEHVALSPLAGVCGRAAGCHAVLVPTRWRDGYANGAALQSSYGHVGGGPPIPSCAIWNLLNNQSEEDMPLLSTADWLKFVVGRSSIDQGVLTHDDKGPATTALGRRLLSEDFLRMEDVAQ